MFSLFKRTSGQKDAETTAQIVVQEVNKILENHQKEINHRINELKAHIRTIDTNIELIERKIIIKDMNDKQSYGQLHYKINEVGQKNLKQEIDNLKKGIRDLKENS